MNQEQTIQLMQILNRNEYISYTLDNPELLNDNCQIQIIKEPSILDIEIFKNEYRELTDVEINSYNINYVKYKPIELTIKLNQHEFDMVWSVLHGNKENIRN